LQLSEDQSTASNALTAFRGPLKGQQSLAAFMRPPRGHESSRGFLRISQRSVMLLQLPEEHLEANNALVAFRGLVSGHQCSYSFQRITQRSKVSRSFHATTQRPSKLSQLLEDQSTASNALAGSRGTSKVQHALAAVRGWSNDQQKLSQLFMGPGQVLFLQLSEGYSKADALATSRHPVVNPGKALRAQG
jgi:hypothetical protein